jgi:hypothetical protein
VERTDTQAVSHAARPKSDTDRHAPACVAPDGAPGRTRTQAIATWLVDQAKRLGLPAWLFWLILAQSTRWATPWVAVISWAGFAVLVTGWVCERGWPGAIRAILGSPLSPMVAAAALSAVINGGWWSRVADWLLYAVALAWMLDRQPDMDRAIVRVGWVVIGACLVEAVYLLQAHVLGQGLVWRVHLLGNPNVIAAMLCIVLPLGRGHLWWGLGLAAMLSTGSLAGMVGLGVYAAVRYRQWWAYGLAGLIAFKPQSALLRLAFWQQAARLFAAHPVFGVGPGMYQYGEWMHAHNILMTILAETGWIGLLGCLVAGLLVTRRGQIGLARLSHVSPILAVLIFYLVDDMTMYWAVSLGVLYLYSREVKQ